MITAGIDYGVRRVAMVFLGVGLRGTAGEARELVLNPKVWKTGEANDQAAQLALHETVFNWTTELGPELVVIESPIQGVSVNVKVGLRLAEMKGALAVACGRAGSSTLSVGPTEWKKAITGHGNADKKQVAEWLTAHHPRLAAECPTQDSIDATCMALYAQDVLGG